MEKLPVIFRANRSGDFKGDVTAVFRDHRCWRCGDGKYPCVQRHPNRCEYPHARND